MIDFPSSYDEELHELPLQKLTQAGQQAIASLDAKGYEVRSGLTPDYADQIAQLALEPSIKEYCPRDSGERFINRETTAHWLSKRRATFLLLERKDSGEFELAGYGWVGMKESSHIPGGETTFSLRISEHHQGRGLATPFSLAILAGTEAIYGPSKMWLETWASNAGAVHIYNKIGFTLVDETKEKRPTAEGEMVPDTRLFMLGGQSTNASASSS